MVAGGMCGWGACMVAGVCVVRGVCGCRGVCMAIRGHAWLWGACMGYDEIRSMSGQYASYWNAFLFCSTFCQNSIVKYVCKDI